jgi:hypothetical protein
MSKLKHVSTPHSANRTSHVGRVLNRMGGRLRTLGKRLRRSRRRRSSRRRSRRRR